MLIASAGAVITSLATATPAPPTIPAALATATPAPPTIPAALATATPAPPTTPTTPATPTPHTTLALAARTSPGLATPRQTTGTVVGHSLLSSRELWATIDVCAPKDEADTVGIRGSMPGDPEGRATTMYMRFQLQYQNAKSGTWMDLAHGSESGFVEVGTGKAARQGGTSFQLIPVKSGPGYTLRGFVTFQWRRHGHVVHETERITTAGHQSLAGSDPPGYSAAECMIS